MIRWFLCLFALSAVAGNFDRDRVVAWCIVPFDAAQRGPGARAQMVADLGLRRVAYDWRKEHVASFETEILQYEKQGIEFFAFWSWHDAIEPLIKKHGISPQIWKSIRADDVASGVAALLRLAEKTKALGLKLGIYNHGGWAGKPANMVAVCKALRAQGHSQVGIVYNFHHGHEDIAKFASAFAAMQPYLLCVNLNGMNDGANPKILGIGQGQHEAALIATVQDSGYSGAIGVLGHIRSEDVRDTLRRNLSGLEKLLADK
jgi:sugar phosphate isomerase/epimerase